MDFSPIRRTMGMRGFKYSLLLLHPCIRVRVHPCTRRTRPLLLRGILWMIGRTRPARTLFNLVKLDLVGLITDYAEIANVQEVVLLEDPDTLYEPAIHGEDIYRCSAEVEMLERALTYRAGIRVTAARILDHFGMSSHLPDLTDLERDQLLRIIYSSNWPDDKPIMISNILSFLGSITASGKTVDERSAQQLKLGANPSTFSVKRPESTLLPIHGGRMWDRTSRRRKYGHPLSGDNAYVYHYRGQTVRQCKACSRIRRQSQQFKDYQRAYRKSPAGREAKNRYRKTTRAKENRRKGYPANREKLVLYSRRTICKTRYIFRYL